MITLGVDPSLTGFGWCVHNSAVVGPARVIAKGVFSTLSKRIFIWRYMFMREALGKVLDAYPEIEAVGVESPPFGELWSEGLYGLFLYVNEAIFLRRKNVVYFDPLRVKLMAKMDPSVRRGSMDKSDMQDAARSETQIRRWNHNEADAYIIGRSAARFWEFYRGDYTEEELTPSEKSIFHKTHTFTRGAKAGKTVKSGLIFKENDRFFQFSLLDPQDIAVAVDFQRGTS
jgi:Holliday junction resolvasome RuvABC endonuclease subunit